VTNTSVYCGFLKQVVIILQFCNYLQLAIMDLLFNAAIGPTHLLTSRILNSPKSTISTTVPSCYNNTHS
jgi:hypothetical protein